MKLRRSVLVLVALVLSLAVFHSPALAQNEEPEDNENPVAAYLAGLTGMSYDEVVALQKDGNGLGNIGRAYLFSEATGMSLEDALAAAKEEGWGNLYKDAGLNPGGNGLGSLIHTGEDGSKVTGPPPWAGGPNAGSDGPGNGNGNANGQGNGNGNPNKGAGGGDD